MRQMCSICGKKDASHGISVDNNLYAGWCESPECLKTVASRVAAVPEALAERIAKMLFTVRGADRAELLIQTDDLGDDGVMLCRADVVENIRRVLQEG